MTWIKVGLIIASIVVAAFFGAFIATLSPDYGKPFLSPSMMLKLSQEPSQPQGSLSLSGFSSATNPSQSISNPSLSGFSSATHP
jgi:hypothetical protein